MSKFKGLMIDLETLDNITTAMVTQIAAVPFDIDTGEKGEELNVHVKWDKGQEYATIGADTTLWWFNQSPEAISRVYSKDINRVSISNALQKLSEHINEHCEQGAIVYCHNTFDAPILNYHFKMNNKPTPYGFRDFEDLRGIARRAIKYGWDYPEINPEYVSHDAVDDCHKQIDWVVDAEKFLGGLICGQQ